MDAENALRLNARAASPAYQAVFGSRRVGCVGRAQTNRGHFRCATRLCNGGNS